MHELNLNNYIKIICKLQINQKNILYHLINFLKLNINIYIMLIKDLIKLSLEYNDNYNFFSKYFNNKYYFNLEKQKEQYWNM